MSYMFNLNRNFLLSTIANFLFFVNFSSFFLLPLFLDEQGFTKSDIGILMGSFGISSILLTPFTSTFIDKFGKKLLGSIALATMIISSILFVYLNSMILLFILRLFQGASFSIFFNSSSALASDNLQDNNRKKGLSIFYSSTIFPYFVGPFFGELIILNYGYVYFFLFSSIFSFLALLIIIKIDSKNYINKTNIKIKFRDFFYIISDAKSKKYLLTNFLSSTGFGIIMNFIAIFLKDKTLKSGLFFAIYSIVVTILRLFMSEFISESKLFKKILIMLMFFSISIYFLPIIDDTLDIIIFAIIFSSTYGLIYPFISSLLVKPGSEDTSGRLFGALNATFGIGVHLMTFFFGYLIHFYGFDFGFKTCSIFIFSITLMLFVKEKKHNE